MAKTDKPNQKNTSLSGNLPAGQPDKSAGNEPINRKSPATSVQKPEKMPHGSKVIITGS